MSDLELLVARIAEAEREPENVWTRICANCRALYFESRLAGLSEAEPVTFEIVEMGQNTLPQNPADSAR
jgi:hypothetical protein